MKCPKCSLFNPATAEFCDCGYSLVGGNPKIHTPEIPADERTWTIALHLAGLLTLLNGYLGPVAVLAIWMVKRREFGFLDRTGKLALNFWATSFILPWLVVGLTLLVKEFLIQGGASGAVLPLTLLTLASIAFMYLGCVFSIVAAVQANEGKAFRYPGGIPFLK